MFPDVCDFVAHLERAGHRVRLKTDEERRITCVFFIHTHGKEELKRLCESVVVDATYSVNSHKFALLNFVVASAVSSEYKRNSLATIHVAGCWMHNGSGESYGWDLKQLRSTVWPTVTDTALLPYNFVTDKDRALMNATKNIFPESNQLLCYVHIMKNFIQRLIKNMTKEVKLDTNENFKWQKKLKGAIYIITFNSKIKSSLQDYKKNYDELVGTDGLCKDDGKDMRDYLDR